MSFLSDGVAVVTGAGSGIGRALAQQLAAAGSALAIADIDEAGLAETTQLLDKEAALVTATILDVADEAGVRGVLEDVGRRDGGVTLPSNKVGGGVEGRLGENSVGDFLCRVNIKFCVVWC